MSAHQGGSGRSWRRWLVAAVPGAALAGLIYGVLMVFGPLGDGREEGWRGVLGHGVFFGPVMLVCFATEEFRQRRKQRSHRAASDPDQL